jgi:hypothetical protein
VTTHLSTLEWIVVGVIAYALVVYVITQTLHRRSLELDEPPVEPERR